MEPARGKKKPLCSLHLWSYPRVGDRRVLFPASSLSIQVLIARRLIPVLVLCWIHRLARCPPLIPTPSSWASQGSTGESLSPRLRRVQVADLQGADGFSAFLLCIQELRTVRGPLGVARSRGKGYCGASRPPGDRSPPCDHRPRIQGSPLHPAGEPGCGFDPPDTVLGVLLSSSWLAWVRMVHGPSRVSLTAFTSFPRHNVTIPSTLSSQAELLGRKVYPVPADPEDGYELKIENIRATLQSLDPAAPKPRQFVLQNRKLCSRTRGSFPFHGCVDGDGVPREQ